MKTAVIMPILARIFYRGCTYGVSVTKLIWGVGSSPLRSFTKCLNPTLSQASAFAAAEPPPPEVKLLHCRKEICAANSKNPAWTGAVASLPGQPATAAPLLARNSPQKGFHPPTWCLKSGQLFHPLHMTILSADGKSWNPTMKPAKLDLDCPSSEDSLPCCSFWTKEQSSQAESSALYQGEELQLTQGVGESGSWEQRCWQGRELLNYNINYLKHHLENHSALLLTSEQQLLVAKTWRRKKKISEKFASPENPDFFSSLLLSI